MVRLEAQTRETIAHLRTGDHVSITWIDASQSRQVSLQRKPLSNRSVETSKSTTGRFLEVQRGGRWHDSHLILGIEKTDELWEIISIPLVLVKQVSSVEAKAPLKKITSRPEKMVFADGNVKTVAVNETIEKGGKLEIKGPDITLTERDYRALIATLLVTGLLTLLLKGDHQSASVIGPLAGSAIGWYFFRQTRG